MFFLFVFITPESVIDKEDIENKQEHIILTKLK